MILWVLYDIVDDKARTKVSKLCLQSGLTRVQYSCFLGTIDAQMLDTLKLQVERLIDESVDKVYIFPMNKAELQQSILLGQAFNRKMITEEIKQLFL